MWSEDFSCGKEGPQPDVTGLKILFDGEYLRLAPGHIFLAARGLAVGFGLLAARTRRPWRRLLAEVSASCGSLLTAAMCLMMMHHGREDQPLDHPAAWIGTLAAFAITIQAWFASGEALRRGIDHWRARRAVRRAERAPADASPARLRVAQQHEESVPAEDEDLDDLLLAEPARAVRRAP